MGGVQVGWGGGWVFSQWGRWGKTSVQTFSNPFLKILIEGAVTTETGSFFRYFTTLTSRSGSYLWVPCRWEGEKWSDPHPNDTRIPWMRYPGQLKVVAGETGKDLCPNLIQPFLEYFNEGAVTTEGGSLFQYFTTLTEKADSLLRRWLSPWSTL